MPIKTPEPWLSFLRDVDRTLERPVEVHCLGGFVLALLWELPRVTGDVDFVDIEPSDADRELTKIAGANSSLARKYSLHFHRVTVAEYPEGYVSRLVDATPEGLRRLRLRGFEVHDLVLAKLSRNSPRDRADVEFLAHGGAIDPEILRDRFNAELRPYVLNEAREAATLDLWLEAFFGT
jgi:hypothetical protein